MGSMKALIELLVLRYYYSFDWKECNFDQCSFAIPFVSITEVIAITSVVEFAIRTIIIFIA